MYKLFTLILSASLVFVLSGQDFPLDSDTGNIMYKDVVELEGDKVSLFNNGKKYFIDSYKNSEEVIQHEDKEKLEIIGKGFSYIYYDYGIPKIGKNKTKLKLYYTLKLDFKENKYRYTIYDLYTESIPTINYPIPQKFTLEEIFINNPRKPKNNKQKAVKEGMIENTQEAVLSIIDGLKNHMEKSASNNDDDW